MKYTRHLVYTSLQHLWYCFSDIKYCMEHALLPLILRRFKIKNQYNRPYKEMNQWSQNICEILKFPSFYIIDDVCICLSVSPNINVYLAFYSFIKSE